MKNLFLLFLTILILSFSSEQKGWKLEKNKNGIQVFSIIKEGESLKTIKAYTKAKSTIATAIGVLADVPNYTEWIYNCSESRMVKKISNHEMIYYTLSNAPWPVEDRDVVVYNKIYQDSLTGVLYSESVPKLDLVPIKEEVVRITDMYGKWKITPLGKDSIAIEYFLKIDPAGLAPNWIVNMVIATGPYQSIYKFTEALKLDKYKNTKVNFMK